MDKKVVRAKCPFFPGFYATVFDFSDAGYYEAQEMASELNSEHHTDRFTEDMFDTDYDAYQDDVAKAYIANIKTRMPEFVDDVQFIKVDSPRYYNFRNDELIVDIFLNDDWADKMESFMMNNKDWLTGRIREDWTSYDGFMSYMDNTFESWYKHIFEDGDERYIETMIAYMIYIDDKYIQESLAFETGEDICIGCYLHLNKEGENLKEEIYEETHQPGWDMTNQTEIKFK